MIKGLFTIKRILLLILLIYISISAFMIYNYYKKPIDLTKTNEDVIVIDTKVPSIVKHVKRTKKVLPVLIYDKVELNKKYKLNLKQDEEVTAIAQHKTDTGTEYITSKINSSGDNVIDVREERSKFRITFDPSLYSEMKVFGSGDADVARIGAKLNVIKINGNIDIYGKAELSMSDINDRSNTKGAIYVGVEWKPLK
jgi:hypothetical protein